MKPLPCLLFAAALFPHAPAVFASTTFGPEQMLFVNNPPDSAVPADLDGDGDMDLIIGGEAGLSVVMNADNAGTFGPRVLIGSVRTALDQTADLDGDGDADILSVQLPGGSSRPIAWHRNEGAGVFSAALAIRTENSLMTMLPPVDADGDGDRDIVWYHGTRDAVEYMANNGAGTFAAPQPLLTAPDLLFPRLLDLNGDAVPDLLAVDNKNTGLGDDDEIVWRPGVAGPPLSFGPAQVIALRTLLTSEDVDGDGRPDVLLASEDGTAIEWTRNLGSGSFAAPALLVAPGGSGYDQVTVADVDHDGDGDIVFTTFDSNVRWARNNGSSFAVPTVLATGSGVVQSFAFARLNADTLPDLLRVDNLRASVHLQGAAQSFPAAVTVADSTGDVTDVAAADIDGDSHPDVLFSTEDGGLFSIRSTGSGSFATAERLRSGLTDLETILPVPLDGAGGVDIVALQPDADFATWLPGSGTGGFGVPLVVDDFGFAPSAVTAAHFNADGAMDLAIAFAGDDACAWYSQNPVTHVFTFHALSGTVASPRAITSGDIDGDGDADIVAVSGINGNVHAWRNNGGTFPAAILLGTGPGGARQCELQDADEDLDADLFVLENDGVSWTVTLYLNDGSGVFPTQTTAATGSAGVSAMAFGDLDQDGDTDFVLPNFNNDSLTWYENSGSGVFTSAALLPAAASSPYDVALADLDSDGDLDVLSVSRFSGRIGWHRNLYTPPPPNDDPVTVWAWNLGMRGPEVTDLASDTDGDGYTLLDEFAYNMNPLAADGTPVTATGTSGPPDFWFTFDGTHRVRGTFMRRRDRVALGLTYIIETSPNLITWTPQTQGTATNVDASYQRTTLNRPLSGTPSRQYVRLRLVYSPPP